MLSPAVTSHGFCYPTLDTGYPPRRTVKACGQRPVRVIADITAIRSSCMVLPRADSDIKPANELQNTFQVGTVFKISAKTPKASRLEERGERSKFTDAIADYRQSTSSCV
jgi:hypothetical protein